MATAGSLLIEIGANVARLQADLGKASRQVDSFVGGVSKTFMMMGIGIGSALSIAGIATFVKSAIDMADAVGKAGEKFGMAVGPLSALKYAAELNEVAFEGLATGLKFLNKSMAEGDKAFGAMGIRVKDSSGNLRMTEDVLLDVAEAFASYEDGAAKTALAVQLFGKAGADMIPFLNQGKAGIREAMEEARRLGVVISTDTAKAADQFNDNLTRLKNQSSGLAISLANQLLPALNALAEGAVKAGEKVKSFFERGNWLENLFAKLSGVSSVYQAAAPGTAPGSGPAAAAGKKGQAPDIKAWEKAAEKKAAEKKKLLEEETRLEEEYTKLHAANMAREGETVHEALAAEMGWTQEYHDLLIKMDTADFEGKKKLEEEWVKLHAANMAKVGEIDHEALGAEVGFGDKPTEPYLFEDAMKAAEAYGDVSLAIQAMNSDLGAHYAMVLEGQAYIGLYKQAWMDANLAVAESMTSLYTGMQNWISSSIQGIVTGTMQVKDVLKGLGQTMLQIISDYIAKWVVSRLFMAAMEKSIATTSMALEKVQTAAFVGSKIAQATASTGAGAARALSEYSWPQSAVVAAAVLAEGAAIIAGMTITSAVAGAAHGGLGYVPAERTYLLDKGERVLSPRQNEDLTEYLEGRSGGGRQETINVNVDGERLFSIIQRGIRQGRLEVAYS